MPVAKNQDIETQYDQLTVLFQLPAQINIPVGLHARELMLSSGGESTAMSLFGFTCPADQV